MRWILFSRDETVGVAGLACRHALMWSFQEYILVDHCYRTSAPGFAQMNKRQRMSMSICNSTQPCLVEYSQVGWGALDRRSEAPHHPGISICLAGTECDCQRWKWMKYFQGMLSNTEIVAIVVEKCIQSLRVPDITHPLPRHIPESFRAIGAIELSRCPAREH